MHKLKQAQRDANNFDIDGRSYQDFYRATYPRVLAYLYASFKLPRHEAEDVAQVVFLNVYNKFHQYRPGSSIKNWVLTITRNTAINHTRKKKLIITKENEAKRKRDLEEFVEEEPIVPVQALPQYIDNPEFRRTFTHFYVDNLEYSEIAEVENISIGTVMSRLHRARKAVVAKRDEIIEDFGLEGFQDSIDSRT